MFFAAYCLLGPYASSKIPSVVSLRESLIAAQVWGLFAQVNLASVSHC
jgi:hypothetical protein